MRLHSFAALAVAGTLACVAAPGAIAEEPRDGAEIRHEVERAGRVSLAVYDEAGRLVRTLHTGAPHAAGEHRATWDGLDRYGRPLPAGKYEWRSIATNGLRAEFVAQVGQNVNPVWEKATGNHAAPSAVAIDETGLYRLGAANEGAHWGVKTDLDGRHLWTNDRWAADPWVQDTAAVTLVGDRLFELMPNGDVYGYDAKTGRVFTGGDHDPRPWNFRWNGFVAPATASDEERRKQNAAESPADLAGDAKNGLVVAAYPRRDAAAWFDAKTGRLVDSVAGLKRLAGVAVDREGSLFAIADGAVVALSRDQKTPRVVVSADKLEAPWRLCVGPKSGDVFVAENGALAGGPAIHCVKRFSSTGELLQTYGRREGRADGAYVATDFRGVTDVEADPDGGFVATEGLHTPPRRSARFSASGELLREWIGAQHYGVLACPEPNDPTHVWTLANAPRPALVRWKVDLETKSSRVVEIHQDVFAANPFAIVPAVPQLFEREGRIYIQGGGLQPTGLSLCVYDPVAKRVRPCNASESRDEKRRTYLWNDLNDDGLASDDEVRWLDRSKLGGWINPRDLSLRTTPTATDFSPARLLRPTRVTAGGTPVYSLDAAEPLAAWREAGMEYFAGDYREADDGSWFGCFSDRLSNPHETHETHGAWYFNSCSGIDRLVKWSADGRPLWSVGRHSPDADHETGSTAMPRGFVGLARGCVVWGDASDEETCRPTVWTEDGLYVDELLRVPTDELPKTLYGQDNTNEYPCGRLHVDARSGDVFYYALNSGGGSPIYRVTGWDGVRRASGSITLAAPTTSVAKRDGTGLKAEYFNNPDCAGAPALTRIDKVVYFNWGKNAPDESITAEEFSVRWSGSYEAAVNEPTRFEIRGGFPWRDPGEPRWARLWLGDELVFDSKPSEAPGGSTFDETERARVGTVRVKLKAGERIDLRLECGFRKGRAAVALSHDAPSLDRRAILPEHLHPEPTGEKERVEIVRDARPETLAHFDFEAFDGPLAWSHAGGDVFGRLTGDARVAPGRVGDGIELAARGEFAPALFPIDEELRLPDENYTIAFWFKTTDGDVKLCETKRYSSYNNRWSDHVVALERGKLVFKLQGDAPLESPDAVADGRWRHVVTTVGSGGQKLYVDGRLIATGKLPKRTRASNRLGLDFGPGAGEGTASFDEVKVFGRALTAEEIVRLAQ